MVFGYAFPAYECYKTVEKNKPDIDQLRFWCQYWILVAILTVFERIGDTFVSWVPMYSEAKLFFFIYLWYPKTKGTTYVYDSFFRPYVAKHEPEIDRNLLELKTRAGDYAVLYWQKVASYGQTRVFDVLQYIASQSTPKPRPPQPPQGTTRVRQPTAARKATATEPPQTEEPPSPAPSASSSEAQEDLVEEKEASEAPTAPAPSTVLNAQKSTVTQTIAVYSKPTTSNEAAAVVVPIEAVSSSSAKEDSNPPPQDTVMGEGIRVTRSRLRRTRTASNR